MGENSIVIPKTNPRFAIFEPKTLEMAKSGDPFKADLILTISSGAEVANETTVIPINNLGIPNLSDIETAAFNNKFPPIIKTVKPKINKEIVFKSIYLFFVKIAHELYIIK